SHGIESRELETALRLTDETVAIDQRSSEALRLQLTASTAFEAVPRTHAAAARPLDLAEKLDIVRAGEQPTEEAEAARRRTSWTAAMDVRVAGIIALGLVIVAGALFYRFRQHESVPKLAVASARAAAPPPTSPVEPTPEAQPRPAPELTFTANVAGPYP